MDLVTKAKVFATVAHRCQRRKYTNTPYIVHPCRVAKTVADAGGSDEMIAAAWLHDVVEDTTFTLDQVVESFGAEVGALVEMLTDVSKPEDGNRAIRKELDRQHLAKASPEAQTIKLADLIDNTRSIVTHDPDFAKVYLAEKRRLLEVLKDGDNSLHVRASQMCEDAE